MKLLALASLIIPVVLSGQTVPYQYSDDITAPGAPDNAAPIDVKEKFKIYGGRIVSPHVFVLTALTAGVRQWQNSPGQWGRGWDGYGKRFGTNYARTAIRDTFAFGVDSALHLDPRFFRAPETAGGGGRMVHALKQVVIARKDNGGQSFAYGSVLGAFASGEASTLWQPRRSDGRFGDGLVYAGVLLAGDAAYNVFREFWPDIRRKIHHNKP